MPSGDALWLPGVDGTIINSESNQFVPLGKSVWELGTNSGISGKAMEDFRKRTDDPNDLAEEAKSHRATDRLETTFVFVSPRPWVGRDDWVTQRNAEGKWKKVVAIDGEDLKRWIESAPSVSLQLAAEIGLVPEQGLQTPELAWDEWSRRTKKPASEALVLAGRATQAGTVLERLRTAPTVFVVRGHSASEAWAFALATIRSAEPKSLREQLLSRTLVVDSQASLAQLTNQRNLIIILKEANGQVSGQLAALGCHVIVPDAFGETAAEIPRSNIWVD
jgi:hypothetical protein